ncbi:hypothetical protein N7507_004812 [Penicillium longicatenatum]|nr:hypothetical protein N7507_004812 [Penicillium longicatenatum]
MLSLFNDFNIIKDVPSSTCGIFNLGANGLIGTSEVDEGNVKKLLKDFEIEGCGSLEPEHKIAVIAHRWRNDLITLSSLAGFQNVFGIQDIV